jgi:hypothetical protein
MNLRIRPSERGSALIVSLLVLLTLTGLGAVAFTSAITAAQGSRLTRNSSQASQVTTGAMVAAVSALRCSSFGDAIIQATAQSPNRTAVLEKNAPLQCVQSFASSGSGEGSGSEFGIFGSGALGDRSGMEPVYYVTYRNAIDARHAEGSEIGTFCMKRVDVSVTGAVSPKVGDVIDEGATMTEGQLNTDGTLRTRMDAEVYAGPFPCANAEN